MIVIDIITWLFFSYLIAFFGTWVYAVLWMIVSIVRTEPPKEETE